MTEQPSERDQAKPAKAKIFISYSRKDMPFADQLAAGLERRGFEPLIDRSQIYAFEDWWKRIEALIAQADTIVFVLSPDAATSEVALKEVSFAASLNKRFAPVVYRPVDDKALPAPLARLNFVFFDREEGFEESADKLAEALGTDIAWVRRHTEFGELARRWTLGGRPRGLLLRSPVLEEAEHWIAARPQGAPAPTEETQDFVQQSRQAATRRRNVLTGSLAAGLLVALVLAGLAYWQRGIAQEQRAVAQKNEAQAKEQRDAALLTQSRFLSDLAQQRLKVLDGETAALLALDVLPDASSGVDRPYAAEAEAALFAARRRIFSTLREAFVLPCPAGQQAVSVAFNPNGRLLATTCNHDKTVRIWDSFTGRLVTVLAGHTDAVVSAVFSPDGRQVATGSYDKTARIWDVESSKTVKVLTGHTAPLRSVAYSGDGQHLVTASSLDKTARIWDLQTGQAVAVLNHPQYVSDAAFSPDGKRVATAALDGTRVWDAQTGTMIAALDNKVATSVTFSPDSRQLAVSEPGPTGPTLWNMETNEKIAVLTGPELDKTSMAVAFSTDGRYLMGNSGDTTRFWEIQSRKNVLVLYGHSGTILGVAFNPHEHSIATASADGTARVWKVNGGNESLPLRGSAFGSASFSPDGRRVVAPSTNNSATIWDASSGQSVLVLKGHTAVVRRAAFSPDGTRVATASSDQTARVWDAASGRQIQVLSGHTGPVTDAQFSPDGKRLVTASDDKTARIWDVASGQALTVLQGHSGRVSTAAFSPDGSKVVTASIDSKAIVWDAATGKPMPGLTLNAGGPLSTAAFSPDGKRIVTSSLAKDPVVWDSASGRLLATLHHRGAVSAAFSRDGNRIVTSGYDGAAHIWDNASGHEIGLIQTPSKILADAEFSPDGSRLMTASLAGGSQIWPVFTTTQALVENVKSLLLHCLTPEERERSFLGPEPPAWCIEKERWPYQTQDWRDWLTFKRAQDNPPLPNTPEWKPWIAAHSEDESSGK